MGLETGIWVLRRDFKARVEKEKKEKKEKEKKNSSRRGKKRFRRH